MIEQLTLTNFRNHETFRIKTENKNVVLTGLNGAGKTNALEAVSLLNGSQGFRRAAPMDIARFGTEEFGAQALLASGTLISIYWQAGNPSRRAKINGEFALLSELSKHIGIVWLTPAEDQLFMGPPSDRRIFLDNLVAGFDNHHMGRVQRLSKLLSERAFALKNNRDDDWIDLLENNITSVASSVAFARVRYASELNHFFLGGEMSLSGMLESKIINGEKAGDFEFFYSQYLQSNRFLTAEKMVIDGPHKSDFSIRNLSLKLPVEKTSAGQQKLMLNKLVIANAKLLKAKNPMKPLVILLDEADGHLDENARSELFDSLSKTDAQIWMSGTDADKFIHVRDSVQLCIDKNLSSQ